MLKGFWFLILLGVFFNACFGDKQEQEKEAPRFVPESPEQTEQRRKKEECLTELRHRWGLSIWGITEFEYIDVPPESGADLVLSATYFHERTTPSSFRVGCKYKNGVFVTAFVPEKIQEQLRIIKLLGD